MWHSIKSYVDFFGLATSPVEEENIKPNPDKPTRGGQAGWSEA
jgi:hypothetical protein